MNKKSIYLFLGITFLITWGVEITMKLKGINFLDGPPFYAPIIIIALMFVPLVASIIVKLVTKEKIIPYGWHWCGWKPILGILIIMPALFSLVYGTTWALGFGKANFSLQIFSQQVKELTGESVNLPSSPWYILGLFLLTCLLTPWINSIVAFGEELGWRGFLLPRLMPLGKTKAYLLLGVIWGLWHAPLIVMGYCFYTNVILGIIIFTMVTTALGWFINDLTLKYKSVFLAAFIHGTFNSQTYGIWKAIFTDIDPFIGGITGVIGIVFITLLAYLTRRRIGPHYEKKLSLS